MKIRELLESQQQYYIDLDFDPEYEWKTVEDLEKQALEWAQGMDLAALHADPEVSAELGKNKKGTLKVKVLSARGPGGSAPDIRFMGSWAELKNIVHKYAADEEDINFFLGQIKPIK